MKVRESKAAKNQQMREAMQHLDDARYILRSNRVRTMAGHTFARGAALDDVDDHLAEAVKLLWAVRDEF